MLCSIKDTQLQQIPQNKSKQQTMKQKQKDSARTDNQVEGEAEGKEKENWGSVHDSMIAGAKPTPTHSGESCLGGA